MPESNKDTAAATEDLAEALATLGQSLLTLARHGVEAVNLAVLDIVAKLKEEDTAPGDDSGNA